MADLFLRDVHLPTGELSDLLVQAGRIAQLGAGLSAPPQTPVLEGRGRTVLPGAIDMHVHFRTPGAEHKETLLTGARAAVKGGTTTCGDMPNTQPRTTTLAALEQKMTLAGGAVANLFFNFGAEPDNLEDVRRAAAEDRVKALKIYMGPSTGEGGLPPDAVERHFRQAAQLDLPVMVHAEALELIAEAAHGHPHDVYHHHELRPLEAELRAAEQALRWARDYGVRLYLCHVTSARVVDLAEASGIRERVFVEVCPHHLALSVDDIASPLENRYKVNPPLRPEAERAGLFAALATRIDGLGSDHAPHTLAEKAAPYDQAPSGMPGVEHRLPLALSWQARGVYDLQRLIGLTSANVARFFGLNKGRVAPGMDADLVLVDRGRQWRIDRDGDAVASRCGWTPYAGQAMQGRPEVTIVAGRLVHDLSA